MKGPGALSFFTSSFQSLICGEKIVSLITFNSYFMVGVITEHLPMPIIVFDNYHKGTWEKVFYVTNMVAAGEYNHRYHIGNDEYLGPRISSCTYEEYGEFFGKVPMPMTTIETSDSNKVNSDIKTLGELIKALVGLELKANREYDGSKTELVNLIKLNREYTMRLFFEIIKDVHRS